MKDFKKQFESRVAEHKLRELRKYSFFKTQRNICVIRVICILFSPNYRLASQFP